jgi:hypothetical protein
MADRAHVSSVDAIESFRSALLVYLSKVRPILDDACDEVSRTREWVRTDRRLYWERQARLRKRALDDARQALFSAELARLRAPTTAEQAAVQHAKREFDEAEDKLRRIKRWSIEFDHQVTPSVKQLEQLRSFLGNDVLKAAATLAEMIKTLDAYSEIHTTREPSSPTPPPPEKPLQPGSGG